MTRKLGGLRLGVLGGTTGIVVAVGMVFGASGITHADPTVEPSPAPSTTSAAPSAAPSAPTSASGPTTVPSAVPTTAPKPTVAVEGGAAAAAATAATAATTGTAAAGATSGDVLDQLADEYATGTGGGQLSNLLKVALKLKAMGFKPSKQYNEELAAAMKARPNQLPLIGALKDTIAYQQKLKAQTDVLSNAQAKQGAAMGAGAAPGPSNPGYGGGPVSVAATPPAAPPPTP